MDWLELGIAGALLAANAFFVLVEFAIVKVRVTRLDELSQKGYSQAAPAREMVERLDEYLSACQLGITIASLGLGWIGEPAMARLLAPVFHRILPEASDTVLHSISFGVAFVVITFLHVVVGELAPKSIAIQYSERSAMASAFGMRAFYKAFYWPLTALNRTSNALLRLVGFQPASGAEMVHSEEELRLLISYAEEHGKVPLKRLLLFENVFDFSAQKVKDAMVHREAIDYLSLRRTWEENLAVIRTRRQTRYPLCDDGLDTCMGYVHMLELAGAMGAGTPDLPALKREVAYVREDARLESVLTEFQQRKVHIALVKDGSGAVVGLITMEDILEELVGEIRDEFEPPPPGSLSEYWVPEAIEFHLEAADRQEAITKLLKKLSGARPEFDYKAAFEAIWRREQGLTSAIGSELALPHGRLEDLKRPLIAIGFSDRGVPFEAPDRKPVKLLFLILTPLKEPTRQLRILANIGNLMSNRALRRRMMRARTTAEVAEILRVFESALPA